MGSFYTGRSKRSSGVMSVTMKDGAKLAKRLSKLEDGGKKAIRRTISDFSSRAPAWVSQGIRQHYGVDTVVVKEAGPIKKRGATRVNVSGISVDGISLTYRGRTLTPLHFRMSPKSMPTSRKARPIRVPGQALSTDSPVAMVRPPRQYKVRATIIKGKRAELPPGTFVAPGRGDVNLPFQRTRASSKSRKVIEAVRTLSVPQMISGRAKETVNDLISTNLQTIFEKRVERAMK